MTTNTDLIAQRLANQMVTQPFGASPEAVVARMGALQGQDYNQAVWAIGARTSSAAVEEVEQAMNAAKIVRTWPMRGTLHFVSASDVGWILRLLAGRLIQADHRRQAQLNLDAAILNRCENIFLNALRGGRHLSRAEMMTLLEQADISTASQRGYHILYYAALTGLICLGPLQAGQQSFVLLDEWVPQPAEISRSEALARLALRYFNGHGPATLRDFAWWAGLPPSDVRAGLAAAREANPGALIAQNLDGQEYWSPAPKDPVPEIDPQEIHLLPGYDEYLLGYTDRGAVLSEEHANSVVPGGNGVFKPIFLAGGRVGGIWQRTLKKGSLEISLRPFVMLDLHSERVNRAAQRFADYWGWNLSSVYTPKSG
jgi:hypothetical protein